MPIETFTAFVVEQAIGITIGVVAIAIAPKLVQGRQKMRSNGETTDSSGSGGKALICQYNFELPVDPISILEMARQVIIENGGIVTGQLPNISISIPTQLGQIDGTCRLVSDSTIHIVVTRKPELVPCSTIRENLILYLKEGVKMYAKRHKHDR